MLLLGDETVSWLDGRPEVTCLPRMDLATVWKYQLWCTCKVWPTTGLEVGWDLDSDLSPRTGRVRIQSARHYQRRLESNSTWILGWFLHDLDPRPGPKPGWVLGMGLRLYPYPRPTCKVGVWVG